MAFDGILLRAAAGEIAAAAVGARVERVFQPDPLTVTLRLYRRGEEHTLLVSCHPRFARTHLTWRDRENPRTPPAFCMLLRRRLEGGAVTAVAQQGLERILRVQVTDRDGEHHTLIAELMGKHSNLILVNGAETIVDALKRVPASLSRHREVLPGKAYVPPPAQDKLGLPPFAGGAQTCADLQARWPAGGVDPTRPADTPAWRRLVELVEGLGPVHARALLSRAGIAADASAAGAAARLDPLCAALAGLAADVAAGCFRPTLAEGAFTAFDPGWEPPGRSVAFDSAGRLLDAAYAPLEEAELVAREHQRLAQCVTAHLGRARTRLAAQEEERREALSAEEYRVMGELLKAQLHLVRPGQAEAWVTDWYDAEQRTRAIPLDPRLSPTANVQIYFKRYARAKRALQVTEEKLARTREEMLYLEGVEAALDTATARAELAEVAAELAEEGYLKEAPAAGQKRAREPRRPAARGGPRAPGARPAGARAPAGEPLSFLSSDGYVILVGKNNRQNDFLTMRAAPDDLWLHTKDIPGSHVVVRLSAGCQGAGAPKAAGPSPETAMPARTLTEAALLAAYFSKARQSSKVPVDYTLRRHVRKPRGARPGMVVYTDQRTLFVTPDTAVITQLRVDRPLTGS